MTKFHLGPRIAAADELEQAIPQKYGGKGHTKTDPYSHHDEANGLGQIGNKAADHSKDRAANEPAKQSAYIGMGRSHLIHVDPSQPQSQPDERTRQHP